MPNDLFANAALANLAPAPQRPSGDNVYVVPPPGPLSYAYGALSIVGTVGGAWHGLKRNHGSVGWAIGWGLLGGAFPFFTLPIAGAQGFGKPGPR